jgi:hypothetical protein
MAGVPKRREEYACFLRQVENGQEGEPWRPKTGDWSFLSGPLLRADLTF